MLQGVSMASMAIVANTLGSFLDHRAAS